MIREIFEEKRRVYGLYNELEMLPYYAENNLLKFIVYGTDDYAVWFIDWIKNKFALTPEFVIDKYNAVDEVCGIKERNYDDFCNESGVAYFVVVADKEYIKSNGPIYQDIMCDLKEHGCKIIFNLSRLVYVAWPEWYAYIKKNAYEFEALYDMLCDDVSKKTLVDYLRTYIKNERYDGRVFPEMYKYWGKDDDTYSLFQIKEDEVVLNLGGYLGDTVFEYLKNDFPYKKIIVVEGDEENIPYLKRNLGFLDDEIKSKIRMDFCYIGSDENTMDKMYMKEDISLIEMDIEGSEIPVLQTGINLIREKRPVLAICAYHKKDDLITIPQFVLNNFDNYILALRKYPSFLFEGYPGIQQINELVLYAIPQERYIPKKS